MVKTSKYEIKIYANITYEDTEGLVPDVWLGYSEICHFDD